MQQLRVTGVKESSPCHCAARGTIWRAPPPGSQGIVSPASHTTQDATASQQSPANSSQRDHTGACVLPGLRQNCRKQYKIKQPINTMRNFLQDCQRWTIGGCICIIKTGSFCCIKATNQAYNHNEENTFISISDQIDQKKQPVRLKTRTLNCASKDLLCSVFRRQLSCGSCKSAAISPLVFIFNTTTPVCKAKANRKYLRILLGGRFSFLVPSSKHLLPVLGPAPPSPDSWRVQSSSRREGQSPDK